MSDDEKAAEKIVNDGIIWNFHNERCVRISSETYCSYEDVIKVAKLCIEHGRKGYIKADKAIDSFNKIILSYFEDPAFEEMRIDMAEELKKELEIEDEKAP